MELLAASRVNLVTFQWEWKAKLAVTFLSRLTMNRRGLKVTFLQPYYLSHCPSYIFLPTSFPPPSILMLPFPSLSHCLLGNCVHCFGQRQETLPLIDTNASESHEWSFRFPSGRKRDTDSHKERQNLWLSETSTFRESLLITCESTASLLSGQAFTCSPAAANCATPVDVYVPMLLAISPSLALSLFILTLNLIVSHVNVYWSLMSCYFSLSPLFLCVDSP